MTALLIGTFFFFWVHSLLWAFRAFIEKKRNRDAIYFANTGSDVSSETSTAGVTAASRKSGKKKMYRRFRPIHIILHLFVIVSFLGLALTGLPLKFSATKWGKVMMDILFEVGKGPLATGDSKTFHYWVAVTDRNREVIARQEFDLPVQFKGKDRAYITDTVANIVIPRGTQTTSGANFEVLIGFDVTPQMAAFNRLGKRFRVNAGSTAVASAGTASSPRQ